jgi:hypothetical protein
MMETVGRIKEGNAMKPTSGGKKSAAKAGSRPQPMSLEKMEEENGKLAELLKQMKRPGQAAGLIEEKKREEVVVVGDEKIRQMVGIRDKLLVLGVEPSSLGSMDSGFNMYNEFCLESKIFSPWQQSDHQMSLFFVWNFLKKNSGATTQNHLNGVRNAWALNPETVGKWRHWKDSERFPLTHRMALAFGKAKWNLKEAKDKRTPIPEQELPMLRPAFVQIAANLVAAKSYWLATLVLVLAARRPGEVFKTYTVMGPKPGPILKDVRFITKDGQPCFDLKSPDCFAMVIQKPQVKNYLEAGKYEIVIPNIPRQFSVIDAFMACCGEESPSLWSEDKRAKPLLEDGKNMMMTYSNFNLAMKRMGKLLGWPASQCLPYCLKITMVTKAGRIGLPDHQMRDVGHWKSEAMHMRYTKPSVLDRARLLEAVAEGQAPKEQLGSLSLIPMPDQQRVEALSRGQNKRIVPKPKGKGLMLRLPARMQGVRIVKGTRKADGKNRLCIRKIGSSSSASSS